MRSHGWTTAFSMSDHRRGRLCRLGSRPGIGRGAHDDPRGRAATATPITIGQAVTGAISVASQRADYTFTVTGGQVVYIEAQAACATNPLEWRLPGSRRWARRTSPNPATTSAARCCDRGHVHDPRRRVGHGHRVLRVHRAERAGRARPPRSPSPSLSAAVSIPSARSATTGSPRTAGEVVYIEAQAACAANPVEWRLLGPDGGPLGIAKSCNDLGRLVLPASGDYTVSVAASGSATGPYAFTVLAVPVEPATTITSARP